MKAIMILLNFCLFTLIVLNVKMTLKVTLLLIFTYSLNAGYLVSGSREGGN